MRVVGQNLLRQKASRQVSEFHAGCCVRPRLLLGHGQLGRTRPTGSVDTDSITHALWEAIYKQFCSFFIIVKGGGVEGSNPGSKKVKQIRLFGIKLT